MDRWICGMVTQWNTLQPEEETLSHAADWMNPEDTLPSEISLTQRTDAVIPLTWGLESQIQRESGVAIARGGWEGGMS